MCDTSEDSQVRRRQLVLAAEQGDAGAQCMLGRMHHEGDGGPVDFLEARRLYGLAAEQGYDQAQFILGHMHHEGEGGPVDFAEARRLLGLAAAQGDDGVLSIDSATCTAAAKAGRKTLPRRGGCMGSLQRKATPVRSVCSAACTTAAAKAGR